MNQVLLSLNIMLAMLAGCAWKSPRFKFWLGYRLQASARADAVRKAHYDELVAQFEEGGIVTRNYDYIPEGIQTARLAVGISRLKERENA